MGASSSYSSIKAFIRSKISDSEAREENLKNILFKMTPEQFNYLKECCKSKENVRDFQSVFETFEFSDEELFELFEIESNDIDADLTFKRRNMHRFTEKSSFKRLLSILKNDISKSPEFFRYYDNTLTNISLSLLELITKNKTCSFEDITKAYNDIITKIEPCLDITNKIDGTDNFKYGSPITSERFRSEILACIIEYCNGCNLEIKKEFILENASYIYVGFLLQFYKKYPEDTKFTNEIVSLLKEKCENSIRDQFGPLSKLIKINIEMDGDTIALFDEIYDKEEDEYATEA